MTQRDSSGAIKGFVSFQLKRQNGSEPEFRMGYWDTNKMEFEQFDVHIKRESDRKSKAIVSRSKFVYESSMIPSLICKRYSSIDHELIKNIINGYEFICSRPYGLQVKTVSQLRGNHQHYKFPMLNILFTYFNLYL